MYEPDFIQTVSRTGSDWSALTDFLLPVVAGLIVACLSWLFGWTGARNKQVRDNTEIREGIHIYILHFSSAARAAFPDAAQPARRLVDAIDSQLGPLLSVCGGVSGRTKAIREVLDLSKPLSAEKPAPGKPAPPNVLLEGAHVLVPGDERAPSELREGFLIKTAEPPSPPKESDLARERRARLLEALDDFHVFWSDRPARLAELESVQYKLTGVRPPEVPGGHPGGGRRAPVSGHGSTASGKVSGTPAGH